MITNRKKPQNVVLILVKGGSVGVPGKNLYEFSGKTLLAHTIAEVNEAGCFSAVYVSTNCERIAAEATTNGAIVILREEKLARNDMYIEAVNHAVKMFIEPPDSVTIPQVVQPIREKGIFGKMLGLLEPDVDSVVTVNQFSSSLNWIYARDQRTLFLSALQSQTRAVDIARREDLFEIDNAIVSFSYDSWRNSTGITPWPYLGSRILGIDQKRLNRNFFVDINYPDDIEWLEFISGFPKWRESRSKHGG